MRIGVISDTHDRLANAEAALDYFAAESVHLVIHCGDWKELATVSHFASHADSKQLPIRGVLGNNDHDVEAFLSLAPTLPGDFELYAGVFELDLDSGGSLAAYHGHHRPTLRKLLDNANHDVLLLGHTHKPKIERTSNKLIVNPGSTAFHIPRSKEWRPSIAIIDTEVMSAQIVYL